MKKLTLTLALLCAACAVTFAGPEPISSGKDKVVQVPVVETSCFEGWYFGVHGGGILSNFNTETTAYEESLGAQGNGFVNAFDESGENEKGAGEGGLQIGYNWKHGGWIFGFEVDLSATSLDRKETAEAFTFLPNNDVFPFTTTVESRATVDWYSTARLRFGHTLGDRVFIYGTGGLAFGLADLTQNTFVTATRFPDFEGIGAVTDNGCSAVRDRGVKFGWTAGAGVDFCVTQHIILSFTYLYIDLADTNTSSDISFVGSVEPRTFFAHTTASSDNNFHVFQGGLSFRF